MKSFGGLLMMAVLLSGVIKSYGQMTESEVPGDHFSLEGALELFKKSESPEEFERLLNSADSKVNNLDLNGDGYVDYIRVLDRYEGNVHAFIIQAVVSENESHDVAVIELEKLANGKAVLQIVGDEDIYGVTTIIEPTREVRTYAGTTTSRTVVNVWAWPAVQYVYGPYYAGWISPWGWHMRPVWWRSWRPVAYVHYHSVWYPYRPYYAVCHTRRVVYAHHIYRPYRTTSVIVYNRHHTQINHYRSAHHDRTQNGRTRNDARRSYVQNDRSSDAGRNQRRENYNTNSRENYNLKTRENKNLNDRTSFQRETSTPANRTYTTQRNVPVDRNSNGFKQENTQERRSFNVPNTRETRPQVTAPAPTKTRAAEVRQDMPQRSSTRERSMPTDVSRKSPSQFSGGNSNRSISVPKNTQTRQQMKTPSSQRQNTIRVPNQQQKQGGSYRQTSGEKKRSR